MGTRGAGLLLLCALALSACAAGARSGLGVESADGGPAYDDVEYVVLRGGAASPPRDSVHVVVYGTVPCSRSPRLYPLGVAAAGWHPDSLRAAGDHGDVFVGRTPAGTDLLVTPTRWTRDAIRVPADRLRYANAVVLAFSGAHDRCDVTGG